MLSGSGGPPSSPLTGYAGRAAWDARKPGRALRASRAERLPALPSSCRDCGAELPTRRHRYCSECRRRRWEVQAHRARRNAAQVLGELRAEGRDPGHGGRAAELRGSKNRAHQRAVMEWSGGRGDPEVFREEILPGLQEARIAQLAGATGLSEHYCSLVRLGKRVPHVRHWQALRSMASPDGEGRGAGPDDHERLG
jgi:hypothetical protein